MFTGHINLCPYGSETHLDGSGTFVRGPGRSWKCSRSVRNVPKRSRYVPARSWKLLEGHGRFWKVPGSTTHSPAGREVGAQQGRGNPPSGGITNSHYGRFPVGRCGKVWKAWESKLDSQTSLGSALGHLATYIR